MRYIGHMDFVRVFQRAVKRSGIDIAYSGGFNPRQRISFALPLPVGAAGLSEYAEINVNGPEDHGRVTRALNDHLPRGVSIIQTRPFYENEKSPASSLTAAKYAVRFPNGAEGKRQTGVNGLGEAIAVFLNGGTGDIGDVISIAAVNDFLMELTVPHGNKKNLKPNVVAGRLCDIMAAAFDPIDITYTRLEMYKDAGGGLTPMFE